jgi:hypothetical protein
MAAAWRRLARRLPGRTAPAATAAVWGLVGLALVLEPALHVYRRVIPSTYDRAWGALTAALEPVGLRQVSYEADRRRALVAGRERGLALRVALTPEHEPALRLSDAELFPNRRVRALEPFALARVTAAPAGRVQVVAARPFAAHGEEVAVLLHPWRPDPALAGVEIALRAEDGRLAGPLPAAVAPGDVLAFEVLLPSRARRPRRCALLPVGPELPLADAGRQARRRRLLTPRFELPAGAERVALEFAAPPEEGACSLRLHRLLPPAARPAAPAAATAP